MKNLLIKYYKYYLLMLLLWSSNGGVFGQDYKAATIKAADGTDLSPANNWTSADGNHKVEWISDGSVKVTGKVFFTSRIKKYSTDLINTTSSEMLLVDWAVYRSKDIIKMDEVETVEYKIGGGLNDSQFYIDMKTESGQGKANLKLYKRKPIFIRRIFQDHENEVSKKFGFDLSDDEWLIYGIEGATSSDVSAKFDTKLSDFVRDNLLGSRTSKDYHDLFNQHHPGSPRWWENAIWNHKISIATNILLFADGYAAFSEFQAAIDEEVANLVVSKEVSETAAIRKVSNEKYSIRNIANKLYYSRNTIASYTAAEALAFGEESSLLGRYNSDTKTYINSGIIANYGELPEDDVSFIPAVWYFNLLNGVSDCKTETFKGTIADRPCRGYSNIPIVAQMVIEDATVAKVSYPGVHTGKYITPYQMFGNLLYDFNENSEIGYAVGPGLISTTSFSYFGKVPEQALPNNIIPVNSETNVALSFADDESLNTFYLISSHQNTDNIESLLPIDHTKYLNNLGKYITSDQSTDFYLYKVAINKANIDITLDANTFLGGDNIVIQNINAVVNNSSNQAVFKLNLDRDPTEDAELTVNGKVLIHSADDKPLSSDFDFGLYVGKQGDAKGVITEDLAILQSDNWKLADYVFQPEYKPLSLDSLEHYIQTQKHLPYVMGQAEVDSAGYYSITDMAMGQLQHLEELYLHTFQQEDQIDKQVSRLEMLKKRLKNIQQKIDKKQ